MLLLETKYKLKGLEFVDVKSKLILEVVITLKVVS